MNGNKKRGRHLVDEKLLSDLPNELLDLIISFHSGTASLDCLPLRRISKSFYVAVERYFLSIKTYDMTSNFIGVELGAQKAVDRISLLQFSPHLSPSLPFHLLRHSPAAVKIGELALDLVVKHQAAILRDAALTIAKKAEAESPPCSSSSSGSTKRVPRNKENGESSSKRQKKEIDLPQAADAAKLEQMAFDLVGTYRSPLHMMTNLTTLSLSSISNALLVPRDLRSLKSLKTLKLIKYSHHLMDARFFPHLPSSLENIELIECHQVSLAALKNALQINRSEVSHHMHVLRSASSDWVAIPAVDELSSQMALKFLKSSDPFIPKAAYFIKNNEYLIDKETVPFYECPVEFPREASSSSSDLAAFVQHMPNVSTGVQLACSALQAYRQDSSSPSAADDDQWIHLKSIRFEGCSFRAETLSMQQFLAEKCCAGLTKFSLTDSGRDPDSPILNISDHSLVEIMNVLIPDAKKPCLEELHLKLGTFGRSQPTSDAILAKIPALKDTLKSLTIGSFVKCACGVSNTLSEAAFSSKLEAIFNQCTLLESVTLSNLPSGSFSPAVATAMERHCNLLKLLELSYCCQGVNAEAVKSLLDSLSQLESLKMTGVGSLGLDYPLFSGSESAQSQPIRYPLKSLSIRSPSEISSTFLLSLLGSCPELQELHLSNIEFADMEFDLIGSSSASSSAQPLETSEAKAEAVAQGEEKFLSIKKLLIREDNLNFSEEPATLDNVAIFLKRLPSVQSLELYSYQLCQSCGLFHPLGENPESEDLAQVLLALRSSNIEFQCNFECKTSVIKFALDKKIDLKLVAAETLTTDLWTVEKIQKQYPRLNIVRGVGLAGLE